VGLQIPRGIHSQVPQEGAVVGFIKGKSAIHLARTYGERKRNFVGQSFWARGFFVSTVGRDEEVIREYIKNQEQEDKRLEPTQPVALIAALAGHINWGRVSDPTCRF
jgi:REP-associated tyrosine transposase